MHRRVVADQAHAEAAQHEGERVGGGREPEDAHRAAMQLAAQQGRGMALAAQRLADAAAHQQQQAGEHVLGVGAHVGAAGLDDAHLAVTAGFEVGVVGAHVQAGDDPQHRREVEELGRDGQLARQHQRLHVVHLAPQCGHVLGKFRAEGDAVPGLQPGLGFGHQPFEQQDFHDQVPRFRPQEPVSSAESRSGVPASGTL
jgi:hypothetical protein